MEESRGEPDSFRTMNTCLLSKTRPSPSNGREEQYLQHINEAGAAVKDKVEFLVDVGDAEDPDAKFAAMEKKVQALQAQLRGDTAGAKRGRNVAPLQKKAVPVCPKEKAAAANEDTQ